MRSKYLLPLAMILAGMSGCGDDSSDDSGDSGFSDGGVRDASTVADSGMDASSGALVPGKYTLSNIQKIEDGCGLTLEDGTLPPLPLVNRGESISLGNEYTRTSTPVAFDPPGYALGSGGYTTSTTANLSVNARVTNDDGCDFMVQRTTVITYTGVNMVSVDYTNKESDHSPECEAAVDNCTSHYTFNMTRTGNLDP